MCYSHPPTVLYQFISNGKSLVTGLPFGIRRAQPHPETSLSMVQNTFEQRKFGPRLTPILICLVKMFTSLYLPEGFLFGSKLSEQKKFEYLNEISPDKIRCPDMGMIPK